METTVEKPKNEPTTVQRLVSLPVKALTISQPFASLIANGEKFVENRVWECRYRGPLAIHAGKGTQYLDRQELKEYPHGGIVAIADLVACVELEAVRLRARAACHVLEVNRVDVDEFLNHEHTEGPWCWVLQNVRPCEFVPCRGAQGLWEYAG